MEAVEQFLQWVKESDNIVFFGGAGVSTKFVCKVLIFD